MVPAIFRPIFFYQNDPECTEMDFKQNFTPSPGLFNKTDFLKGLALLDLGFEIGLAFGFALGFTISKIDNENNS